MSTQPSVRTLLAVGLWQTNCTQAAIANFLGVSRQRVEQMLDRAGVEREPVSDAEIIAAIRAVQARGLVRRSDIIRAAKGRTRWNADRISVLITQASGAKPGAVYIPPPGTPAGWRYCIRCEAFAPPSSRGSHCPTHYNEAQRELSLRLRRAAGIGTPAEAGAQRRQRSRDRVASVTHLSRREAAAVLGLSVAGLDSLRRVYGRDGRRGL